MKIYDCFLYNGEDKMLNFRLHELNDAVEKFIIVEANSTFKGDFKELKFNISNFKKFEHKIIYKPYTETSTNDAWKNEKNQRCFLKQGFKNVMINSNDIIMLSDVDEIPDIDVLNKLKQENFKGAKSFYHNFYYYNYKCKKKKNWPGTVIMDAFTLKNRFNVDFEEVRCNRWGLPKFGENDNQGGWHFSYFGDEKYIINKIKSFSHQEYNNLEYTNPEKIKELIKNGKDLFFRNDEDMDILESQTYLPKYIHLLD